VWWGATFFQEKEVPMRRKPVIRGIDDDEGNNLKS
jgi:hypothetical protein